MSFKRSEILAELRRVTESHVVYRRTDNRHAAEIEVLAERLEDDGRAGRANEILPSTEDF